uniref:Uncharacterized protein n=1 Tax=Anguilla anguilla TaxID=7936 RepID=A0A0E9VKQ1_ANGAN
MYFECNCVSNVWLLGWSGCYGLWAK